MEASTLIDPKIAEAVEAVVPVVAHGPLEHGTYDTTVDGRSVARCRLYRNLECSEHQATHEALKPYQGAGRFRIPFTVWIDPEGNKLFRRDGWRRPEEFHFDMRLALEKVPGKRLSKAEFTAFIKPLDEGFADLAAQRYAQAAAKFEEARKPDVAEIRRSAEAGLKQILDFGDSILKAAKVALKAGHAGQARPALDLVAREFPGLECGREALDLVRKLPFPLRGLTLRDAEGPAGGRNLYLRGDGTCVVQVVSPPKEGSTGPVERRFESRLAAQDWEELAKLFETHRFFDVRIPERTGAPGEGRATLAVELWTGESGTAAKWHGDNQPAFDAIHTWLLSRAGTASSGRPRAEGAYDPAWRPAGFAK